jgi:hypothetical protein
LVALLVFQHKPAGKLVICKIVNESIVMLVDSKTNVS